MAYGYNSATRMSCGISERNLPLHQIHGLEGYNRYLDYGSNQGPQDPGRGVYIVLQPAIKSKLISVVIDIQITFVANQNGNPTITFSLTAGNTTLTTWSAQISYRNSATVTYNRTFTSSNTEWAALRDNLVLVTINSTLNNTATIDKYKAYITRTFTFQLPQSGDPILATQLGDINIFGQGYLSGTTTITDTGAIPEHPLRNQILDQAHSGYGYYGSGDMGTVIATQIWRGAGVLIKPDGDYSLTYAWTHNIRGERYMNNT